MRTTRTERRARPGVAITLGILAAAGAALVLQQQGWVPELAWVAALSAVTALTFGLDKLLARRGGPRVSERALLTLSLLGGSPGALVAMPLFRHKTVKGSFRRAFFGVIALQIVLVASAWWLLREV